jgi:hypothetical protein
VKIWQTVGAEKIAEAIMQAILSWHKNITLVL